mmetsp:Transcript_36942/g.80904  ORF Transcript_36942/g.80904 Transcript_36942/m.80904 type:complete len:554 (-) Transcript_36942:44-1705(-)
MTPATGTTSSSRRSTRSGSSSGGGGTLNDAEGGDAARAAAVTKKGTRKKPNNSTKKENKKKKKRGRGRPPKKDANTATATTVASDPSRDVLYLKGAAAQTTTHPGNLAYYDLCERHYDEFSKLPEGHPTRRSICERIIDEIERSGGCFRKAGGGTMNRSAAIQKTKDRMRQISRPKIRPNIVAAASTSARDGDGAVGDGAVGENDVVLVSGATNHLYPGNARWRALLRGYVNRYWKDWIRRSSGDSDPDNKNATRKGGRFYRGERKPQYQHDISERTVSIIASRGGKFRNGRMTELSHDEALKKTHQMFKDLKKELRRGKVFVDHDDGGNVMMKGDSAEGAATAAKVATHAEESIPITVPTVSRTGCTSVKSTVTSGDAIRKMRKKKTRKKKKSKKSKHDEEDVNDNASFDSGMLESDDGGDGGGDGSGSESEASVDNRWKDMLAKRPSKRKQAQEREERSKRRKSGQVQAPGSSVVSEEEKKRREMKMRTNRQGRKAASPTSPAEAEEEDERNRPPSPKYSLSEYELRRLEKIKRNQERLVELGLAGRCFDI